MNSNSPWPVLSVHRLRGADTVSRMKCGSRSFVRRTGVVGALCTAVALAGCSGDLNPSVSATGSVNGRPARGQLETTQLTVHNAGPSIADLRLYLRGAPLAIPPQWRGGDATYDQWYEHRYVDPTSDCRVVQPDGLMDCGPIAHDQTRTLTLVSTPIDAKEFVWQPVVVTPECVGDWPFGASCDDTELQGTPFHEIVH